MPRPKKIKDTVAEGSTEAMSQVEVVPSIEVVGQKNAFKALFEGGTPPTLKSVGYFQMPGTNTYVAYSIVSRGSQILKVECEEPNMRNIAEECAKTFFVGIFMTGDENVSAP